MQQPAGQITDQFDGVDLVAELAAAAGLLAALGGSVPDDPDDIPTALCIISRPTTLPLPSCRTTYARTDY